MKRKHATNQIMVLVLFLLFAVLAAIICGRAELVEKERPVETEDATLRIYPPVVEAYGYYEGTGAEPGAATPAPTPPPTPDPTPTPVQTPAAVEEQAEPEPSEGPINDGYGEDYIYAIVSDGPNRGSHIVEINIARDVHITAYCPCEICCGYWATTRPVDEYGNQIVYTGTGARAVQGITVAVNPEFIPHGSYVYVQDPYTGAWREYRATDTSPQMNHVDIYFSDHTAALRSGYGDYSTVYWSAEPVDLETLA